MNSIADVNNPGKGCVVPSPSGTRPRRPARTCCGCGQRAPQGELVRMTVIDGVVALDRGCRAAGRGAYLHRQATCWSAFARAKGYVRSLRRRLSQQERADVAAAVAGWVADARKGAVAVTGQAG